MDASSSLPRTLPHGIRDRQLGSTGLREACLTDSLWRLSLATSTEVAYPARSGPCNWLDLDRQDQRYLLAAGGDGSVSAYDVVGSGVPSSSPSSAPPPPAAAAEASVIPPLFVAGGGAAGERGQLQPSRDRGHRRAATCACWYPVDGGAFVSGGADGEVKVWDANEALPVASFSLPSPGSWGGRGTSRGGEGVAGAPTPRVMAVAMSPAAAASHALVAVGAAAGGTPAAISSAPAVASSVASSTAFAPLRLADVRAGAFTHTLGGSGSGGSRSNPSSSPSCSTAAVWCVAWSLSDANQLVSGSADGTARAWDVRRSDACVATLDAEDTRDARREERERARARERAREREREATGGRQRRASSGDGGSSPLPSAPLPPQRTPTAYRRAHDAAITGLVPTPDGLSWVTSGADSAVRVWSSSDFALDERAPSPSSASSSAAGATFNRARRPRQLAASLAPAALFHPSGSGVQVLPLPGGGDRGGYYDDEGASQQQQKHVGNLDAVAQGRRRTGRGTKERGLLLRGHVDAVHACCWCESRRELYTGGDDKTVLVWSASATVGGGGGLEEEEDGEDGDDIDGGYGERRRPRRRGAGAGDEDAWSD